MLQKEDSLKKIFFKAEIDGLRDLFAHTGEFKLSLGKELIIHHRKLKPKK